MQCDYRFENLTAQLSDNISTLRDDPFDLVNIICSSKTMEQYLNKVVADNRVISANISYRFPRNAINDILKKLSVPESVTRLDREVMVWEIYRLLPEVEDDPIYAPVKEYMDAEPELREFRRYQISLKIAEIFDNYIGYRGDWLELWQEGGTVRSGKNPRGVGPHELWQADLWRKLTVQKDKPVRFVRSSQLLSANIARLPSLLPSKISVFGISNLSPDYITCLAILNRVINLDFYYLTPCVEYWGDANRKDAAIHEERNFLLASWGVVGRDFQELLLENGFDDLGDIISGVDVEDFEHSILTALQYDILTDTAASASDSCITRISPEQIKNDDSIVVNNCYTRMREVEVLRDYIIDLMNEGECGPSDIVVMAPDIEVYAPYIQAVFHSSGSAKYAEKEENIPYKLADCSTIYTLPEAETFMKIVSIPGGRMTSEDLYEIISSEPVMAKFNISPEELEIIYDLISRSGIAWGRDAEHRKNILGQDYSDVNTWHFGFERILAGYAFDKNEPLADGTLPLSMDTATGITAGKLIAITNKLFRYADMLSEPHTPGEWHDLVLTEIISEFLEIPNRKNEDIQLLYTTVAEFRTLCGEAGVEEEIPLDVIKAVLENTLASSSSSRRSFFRGGVTFCQLLPMRNIPFKSVCLLGMNDGEFPRIETKSGFDLMNQEPRRGDRSLRNEDSFIFLELLLACRENLYISYLGQSHSDNKKISPSVLVDEMLDHISIASKIQKESLVTEHPLHAFDEKYFAVTSNLSRKDLFSYSEIYRRAGEVFANSAKVENSFFQISEELSKPDDPSSLECSFGQFAAFFVAPVKAFLRYRLNINLYDPGLEPLKNSEPMSVGALEKYQIKSDFVEYKRQGQNFDLKAKIKASGIVPPGIWGDAILVNEESVVNLIFDEISKYGEKLPETEEKILQFQIGGDLFTLKGAFNNLYQDAMIFFRPSGIKNKDRIEAYFWHRLAIETGCTTSKAVIIGFSGGDIEVETYEYDDPAKDVLKNSFLKIISMQELVEIFVKGLCKPLPLFQFSSMEYCIQKEKNMRKLKSREQNDLYKEDVRLIEEQALKSASLKWEKSDRGYESDMNEKANVICFGEHPPSDNPALKEEFKDLAEKIYGGVVLKGLPSA